MNLDDTLAELERAIQQTPYESGATSPAPEPDGPRKYQEVYRDADGATGSRPLSPREQQRKQVWINRANELRRNAVRFEMTRSRSDHRADAIKMLRVWGEDLNANWPLMCGAGPPRRSRSSTSTVSCWAGTTTTFGGTATTVATRLWATMLSEYHGDRGDLDRTPHGSWADQVGSRGTLAGPGQGLSRQCPPPHGRRCPGARPRDAPRHEAASPTFSAHGAPPTAPTCETRAHDRQRCTAHVGLAPACRTGLSSMRDADARAEVQTDLP